MVIVFVDSETARDLGSDVSGVVCVFGATVGLAYVVVEIVGDDLDLAMERVWGRAGHAIIRGRLLSY